jgi:phosphoribosylformylglycinamidine synthase
MLKFTIKEKDRTTAQTKVQEICDELRIYNPMVSKVTLFCEEVLS